MQQKVTKRRLCKVCLKQYKRAFPRRVAQRLGKPWGKGNWPDSIYIVSAVRMCPYHHARSLADGSQRRARKLSATPQWADQKAIRDVFARCIAISKETGVAHEVDHIVPLRGKRVSGLHVPDNLQIITARANSKKSNHFYE
jgi:5-methylcytosine-specific restriction endonuclease McrA